jgi:hypothetical protein
LTQQTLHSLGKELLVPNDKRLSDLRASLDVVAKNKIPDVQLIAIFWHVLSQILCQEVTELKPVPIFSKDLKFV